MVESTNISVENVVKVLKQHGKRITKQRLTMINVIIRNDCHNLKELYYEIEKIDPSIGQATVYRMVTTLEEVGIIKRVQGYIIK